MSYFSKKPFFVSILCLILLASLVVLTPVWAHASFLWASQPGWEIETISIDENSNPGNHSGYSAWEPILSGNGRYVLFSSRATNFVPGNDTNGNGVDVILHDRITGQKEFVGLGWDGQQAGGEGSFGDWISHDGRYILFTSKANGLVENVDASSGFYQIYLRDRQSGTTELISGVDGVVGNSYSVTPGMSEDGRYVIFKTNADNLVPGGLQNDNEAVVLLDRVTGQRELINVRSDGERFGSAAALEGGTVSVISGDGRFVIFATRGNDPAAGDTNGRFDIYLRDRIAGTTTWVSNAVPADFVTGNDGCLKAALSLNGQFVAYICNAYDLQQNKSYNSVFVTDLTTQQTTLESVNEIGERIDTGEFPSISPNGRYVGFRWAGFPEFPGQPGQYDQVAIRDRQTAHTALLTQTQNGTSYGNRYGYHSSFSADSSLVAFDTYATNISAPYVPPTNVNNVFVRALPLPVSIPTATLTLTPTPTNTPTPTPTPQPVTVIFDSVADTYVRSGQANHNQGAESFMRVQPSGDNRSLVLFDQQELEASISGAVLSAKLRLTIINNGNNWGATGRSVDVHRLIKHWVEGNGTENNRGTGSGATWNCAIDSIIANQAKNCSGEAEWEMGQPNNPLVHPWIQTATDSKTITNNQTGVVEYDVTIDVQSFMNGTNNYGWIIKKTNESQTGTVSFGTKESVSLPQLIVTYQP